MKGGDACLNLVFEISKLAQCWYYPRTLTVAIIEGCSAGLERVRWRPGLDWGATVIRFDQPHRMPA